MNHIQILKRAWHILWSYRSLWVFGILFALTTGSGGSNNFSSSTGGQNSGGQEAPYSMPSGLEKFFSEVTKNADQFFNQKVLPNATMIILVTLILFLVIAVVFSFIHYISQVALIRMVDDYETTGEKVGVRQGFRLGWSRSAWRLFLIDLIINLPVVIVFLILFGCAAIPVVMGLLIQNEPSVPGIISTIGMVFVLVFLAILVSSILAIVIEPIRRVCTLQEEGVITSIRNGWNLVRGHLWDILLLWIILIGVQIAFSVVLIPLVILLLLVGGLGGGIAGIGLFALISALGSQISAWITGIIVGALIFFLVIGLPLLFCDGLKECYLSSCWTLAYREIGPQTKIAPVLVIDQEPPEASQPVAG